MDVFNAIGDIFYGGIQPNIPGNGGPDCVAFLSKGQLLFETLLGTALVVLFSLCGAKTYTLPAKVASAGKEPLFKKVLLVVLSVVFAIEIVYKVCSRQLLYLLNPCHVCTVLEVPHASKEYGNCKINVLSDPINQIYLLLSKPRRIAFAVLRSVVFGWTTRLEMISFFSLPCNTGN